MRRCSVNSFDLNRARELSQLLTHGGQALRLVPPPTQAAVQSSVAPPPVPAPAGKGAPEVDLHAAPLDFESWEVLLAWSLELCRARGGFVVDSQGFVVATRGNVPANQFEGLGAEMAYAMEQLDRIDPDAGALQTLELQYVSRRLLAVRVHKEESGSFVLGFVGARPLADEVRTVILRQLTHSLGQLL